MLGGTHSARLGAGSELARPPLTSSGSEDCYLEELKLAAENKREVSREMPTIQPGHRVPSHPRKYDVCNNDRHRCGGYRSIPAVQG